MKKVLIAAPLRQDPKIFEEYQKGLDSLIIPDDVMVDRFFVVNNCVEVLPYIRRADWVEINTERFHAEVFHRLHVSRIFD